MSRRVTFARVWTVTVALTALGGAAGCDLLEFARNPSVTFQLPEQKFTIKNQDWKQPPSTFNMAISCAKDADCCTVPGAPAGTPLPFNCQDYSLVCDAGTCAMKFPLELYRTVDLAKEAPTLAAMKGKVVSDIVLQSMEYTVNNQLSVALPPVTIHMAPMAVVTAADPKAKPLTTVPMIPAASMRTDTAPLTEDGQKTFSAFARDYKTPFNFIATATILMRSGAPVPAQSQIDVGFTGTVTAKF